MVHRTTSACRAQANGMIEHLNSVMGRALIAALEKGNVQTWENRLQDFLAGYRGLKHASTGKSPYQLLLSRPMRPAWKLQAMPRNLVPDNQGGPALEEHMRKLLLSLEILQSSAREGILKQQVRNMKSYNSRRAVSGPGDAVTYRVGDLVWLKDVNPRKNKLKQAFMGPYFICSFVGDQRLVVELSLDGTHKLVRSIEHICHYHKHLGRKKEGALLAEAEVSEDVDAGAQQEKPYLELGSTIGSTPEVGGPDDGERQLVSQSEGRRIWIVRGPATSTKCQILACWALQAAWSILMLEVSMCLEGIVKKLANR